MTNGLCFHHTQKYNVGLIAELEKEVSLSHDNTQLEADRLQQTKKIPLVKNTRVFSWFFKYCFEYQVFLKQHPGVFFSGHQSKR